MRNLLDKEGKCAIVLNANELHLHLELLCVRKKIMLDVILDTLVDAAKLIPFLFLTYLVMEYLEHRTGEKTQRLVRSAGKWGPVWGGILGALPQCGFSAAASNFYAGRVISMGTLLAIYLSTSDEMLPILISERAPIGMIGRILFAKMVIGGVAGLLIDMLLSGKQEEQEHIHELCEHDHCHCEEGILRSALRHTVQITFFILLVTFALNLVIRFVGEDTLAGLILNRPVIGPILAGLVGLIPNCAASVVITQLYLENAMSVGAMMAGLLVGAGIGLLVLFRVNHNKKENLKIVGLLYFVGVIAGIVIDLFLTGI